MIAARMIRIAWQRHHGTDVVAEIRGDDRDRSRASTGLRRNPTVIVRVSKPVELRSSACAKADALARKTFDHVCGLDACAEWLPLEVKAPAE
jgi:hypothetical protein